MKAVTITAAQRTSGNYGEVVLHTNAGQRCQTMSDHGLVRPRSAETKDRTKRDIPLISRTCILISAEIGGTV